MDIATEDRRSLAATALSLTAAIVGLILPAYSILAPLFDSMDSKNQEIYDQAIEYFDQGEYGKAWGTFDKLNSSSAGFPALSAYQNFCRAKTYYEEGHYTLSRVILSRIDEDKLEDRHRARLASLRAAVEQGYVSSLKQELPFEGMPEAYIDCTSLGKHIFYEEWTDPIPGSTPYHEYHFIETEGYWYFTYFRAGCQDGKVVFTGRYKKPNHTYRSSSGTAHSRHFSPDEDEYGVNAYNSAEEFYEDYYDEFDSFEEAEDYFETYAD